MCCGLSSPASHRECSGKGCGHGTSLMPIAEHNCCLLVVRRLNPLIRLKSGFILPLSCSCCVLLYISLQGSHGLRGLTLQCAKLSSTLREMAAPFSKVENLPQKLVF